MTETSRSNEARVAPVSLEQFGFLILLVLAPVIGGLFDVPISVSRSFSAGVAGCAVLYAMLFSSEMKSPLSRGAGIVAVFFLARVCAYIGHPLLVIAAAGLDGFVAAAVISISVVQMMALMPSRMIQPVQSYLAQNAQFCALALMGLMSLVLGWVLVPEHSPVYNFVGLVAMALAIATMLGLPKTATCPYLVPLFTSVLNLMLFPIVFNTDLTAAMALSVHAYAVAGLMGLGAYVIIVDDASAIEKWALKPKKEQAT